MTDIMVTVPKDQVGHWRDEKCAGPFEEAFWNLAVKPKELEAGDYIYFVVGGRETHRAQVTEITRGSQRCLSTNHNWKGCQIIFNTTSVESLENPRETKGFRGFRYRRTA